jgi:hypothetical protein
VTFEDKGDIARHADLFWWLEPLIDMVNVVFTSIQMHAGSGPLRPAPSGDCEHKGEGEEKEKENEVQHRPYWA